MCGVSTNKHPKPVTQSVNLLIPSSLQLSECFGRYKALSRRMGCTSSILQSGVGFKRKKMTIPEAAVVSPSLWIPLQIDFQKALKGLLPRHLIDRLVALRSRITLVAQDTDGSAIGEIKRALEEYLPILLGLTKKEYGLEDSVEFKWISLADRGQELCISSSWFELLSVIYMLTVLTLQEANLLLIPKDNDGSSEKIVSSDCQRDAIDLVLKASGYLDFCVKGILSHLDPNVKKKLPKELQEGVLEALKIQAIGQGTELQLGLATENQKATLSVKRRLACEQLTYFSQAHFTLLECDIDSDGLTKHSTFIRWKYLEAKAAAYYYHGLIIDKGSEPQCHISAVSCFLAAEQLLAESKKACLTFCLATPISRAPPPWGVMKHLHQKIPEMASKRAQMYGYLLDQEKELQAPPPDLPEFQLSLRPDDFELPTLNPAWDRENWEKPGQALKEHLEVSDDGSETE